MRWIASPGIARLESAERAVEEVERLRLCLARVGRKRSLTPRRLDPARGDRHQFLVQPLRALPVEREAAEQDHARNRVGGLREAGAREVVVDEALRAEARKQALGDPLLEMQMDGVLGEYARVLENDRPDRRLAAPVGELLVLLPGRAESVEGRGPARIGLRAAVERAGRSRPADRRPSVLLDERLGAEELQGAGQRVAERRGLEACPGTRGLEQVLAALDLRLQVSPGARAPPRALPR